MNIPLKNTQKGLSAWVVLPWALFLMMSFVFWWFWQHPVSQTQPVAQTALPVQNQPQINSQINSDKVPKLEYADSPPTEQTGQVVSYHDAVAKAAVSVVNIYTTQKSRQGAYYDDPAFRLFLEQHGYDIPNSGNETNLGSGVIVSSDGYIVTNAHVVDKADEIVVALSDGKKSVAKVIGSDKDSDLAVIKIEMSGLTPLTFKSTPIAVGDVVLAIGNPFGVGQTVTQGIVSATGRTGLGVSTYEDFIQTDAAINPGNSGGALVDAYGNLIGINTVIYSRSGGSMGLGFAIPTVIVEKVMNDLMTTGRVNRGWLGIQVTELIDEPTSLNSSQGVQVMSVVPNAAADKAGIQVGDVIVSINDTPMNNANALIQYISKHSPSTELRVLINRGDNQMLVNVTLDERPSPNRE